MIGKLINNELERIRKWLWLNLRYYPGIFLEKLKKMRNFSCQNARLISEVKTTQI
jgi:hypothetical protein